MRPASRFPKLFLKYLTIFLVLNLIHYLFKHYDHSFQVFNHEQSRGALFYVFFLAYGLIVWSIGIWITSQVNRITVKYFRQILSFIIAGIILALYAISISALYGELYFRLFFVPFHLEYLWSDYALFDPEIMVMFLVISLIIIGFHSFIYYFQNWQQAELTSERLQKENLRSQFESLKHQIEPHFFFNSLSVLTSLVHKDADLATTYIAQLSKMYRYLLEVKNEAVVPLANELEFLNSYIFLMTIRHNDSVRFITKINDESAKYIFVPRNSLQMLAENAVKHNRFSKESPLVVRITEDGEFIKVINNLDKRELIENSSGIGLENIRKRYEMISEKEIELEETSFTFCVKLPKLEKSELKGIDL